jgi:hypothetical protein
VAETPTREPTSVRAGTTWAWRREDLTADYPAPTWTLTYWFKRTGTAGGNFSVVASADGAAFAVSQTVAQTGPRGPGKYTWTAIVSDGSAAHEVGNGRMTVLARYDATGDLDDRSHPRKVLEAIEAVIEGRATKDQESYTIGDRSLDRTPIADLLTLRDRYLGYVADEEAAAGVAGGLPNPRAVGVRMTRV